MLNLWPVLYYKSGVTRESTSHMCLELLGYFCFVLCFYYQENKINTTYLRIIEELL